MSVHARYREMCTALALDTPAVAFLTGVDDRTARRWARGEYEAPAPVLRLLWACVRVPDLVDAIMEEWGDVSHTGHTAGEQA